MNLAEFQELLNGRRGASPITVTAWTEPDWAPKRDTGPNPYKGRVKKLATVNGMIGWQYELAVNRQRVREGREPDFDALPRKWGRRIHGTPWVIHNDNLYLELKCERVISSALLDIETLQEVPEAWAFIRRSGNPRQQLDREIILRDYRLDHIRAFTWGGVAEEIQHAA